MRKIIKPIMMSAVFMLSLTSCGGKSAAEMVDSLKSNEFEVQQLTTKDNQDELNALELLINALKLMMLEHTQLEFMNLDPLMKLI